MAPAAARGRPRSFDRDAALDRAIRLFWRKGYQATSIRDLSEELGIGQPSLYNAFGDKRGLFTEAVDVYDRTYGGFIRVALEDEATAAQAIRRILAEAPVRYTRRGLPRGCLVALGDAGAEDDRIRASLSRMRKENADRLRRKIEADVATGVLPEGTDATGLAGHVLAVLNGLALQSRDGTPRRELERITRIAAATLPITP